MQGGIETIKPYVDKFVEFAEYEKALTFYVTKIGCGIAGFNIKDIAPLFRNAYNLQNVILHIEFAVYIENENRLIHPQKILDIMEVAHEARVKHLDTPIKIIGVGGGGTSVVGRMIENPSAYAEYSIISDDVNTISRSNVPYRYQLQYADPCAAKQIYTQKEFERYFANRNENINLVHSILDDSVKHLIIVAGFGGGISMYCSEWIAKLAKKAHIPVTVVCTIPFDFEGKRKQERALDAAYSLLANGIDVKILKAEDLKQRYSDISLFDCFSLLDGYVAEAVNHLCEELSVSRNEDENNAYPAVDKLPCEVTTHCYGMTRTFADIIIGLNGEKHYTSPDDAVADLGAYIRRFNECGDNIAFLAVKTIRHILHDNDVFKNGKLNISRLCELVFDNNNFISECDRAYDLYCKEKLMNLISYLNEFRRYQRQIDIEYDLIAIERESKKRIFKLSYCSPTETPVFFNMHGSSSMNYPVRFFVRAIRNLWTEITTDGVLDAEKMRKLMFSNHDESVNRIGLDETLKRDYIEDSPCHPEVFVPKIMGTGPIYVKKKSGHYIRSCGEGKGPNSIPDWLEFQIAKQILENDKSYKLIGNYYIPKYDNTLPVYGEYSGRIVFNTQAEKLRFIEDVKKGKSVWR